MRRDKTVLVMLLAWTTLSGCENKGKTTATAMVASNQGGPYKLARYASLDEAIAHLKQ